MWPRVQDIKIYRTKEHSEGVVLTSDHVMVPRRGERGVLKKGKSLGRNEKETGGGWVVVC